MRIVTVWFIHKAWEARQGTATPATRPLCAVAWPSLSCNYGQAQEEGCRAKQKEKKEREEKQTNENAKKQKGQQKRAMRSERRETRNERNITKKLLQLARRGCGRGILMAGGSELGTEWAVVECEECVCVCGAASSAMPCLRLGSAWLSRQRQREAEADVDVDIVCVCVVCAPVLVLITKPKNSTPKNTHTHTWTHRQTGRAWHTHVM